VTIFVLVSVFYGLVWIPSQQLQVSQEQLKISVATFNFNNELAQLSLAKIRNSCQIIAQNSMTEYEKRNNNQLTEEQKKQLANQFFSNCLFTEGLQLQTQNNNQKK